MARQQVGSYLERPAPSRLADVVELILDKGLVVDAYVRISLVGIEFLTLDARLIPRPGDCSGDEPGAVRPPRFTELVMTIYPP